MFGNRKLTTGAVTAIVIGIVTALSVATADAAGRFSVERSGDVDGETVLLIPGLASSGAVWDGTEAALSGYDVHTVTLAGFAGEPAPDPMTPFIDGAVEDLAAYLEEEGLEDVSVAGHSLGGMLALKLAAASERVGEAVIVDALPFTAAVFMPGVAPEQAAAQGKAMGEQMAAMPHEAFLQQQKMSAARMTNDPAYADTIIEWGAASDQTAVATAMGELLAIDYRDDLAEIDAPITVLAAGSGQPEAMVRGLYESQYEAAPKVEIVVIPDSQHFIMHDQPEAFENALRSALEN